MAKQALDRQVLEVMGRGFPQIEIGVVANPLGRYLLPECRFFGISISQLSCASLLVKFIAHRRISIKSQNIIENWTLIKDLSADV